MSCDQAGKGIDSTEQIMRKLRSICQRWFTLKGVSDAKEKFLSDSQLGFVLQNIPHPEGRLSCRIPPRFCSEDFETVMLKKGSAFHI